MRSRSLSRSGEFSAAQCARLYDAVRTHDEIDVAAAMPDAIHLDYDQDQLWRCYRLCRQSWRDGVDRLAFLGIARRARRHRLSEGDIASFRDIRAKFKQLRFAYGTLGDTHRYPKVFDWATQTMGRLQDGIRNGDTAAVARNALALRLLLSPIPYWLIRREIDRFRPAAIGDVREHVRGEVAAIDAAIGRAEITGKAFHRLRKSISRQVAFYDTLKTLYPSAYHQAAGRYLGTINGMMGALHDELVTARHGDPLGYHERGFRLPPAIRERLEALVRSYRAGDTARAG